MQSLLYFYKAKKLLIVARVNRSEIDRDGHLSMINLLDAISQLHEIQREFVKLFSRSIDTNKVEELHKSESENLEVLLNVWKFLEETNLQKIYSVVYGQKNLLKRRKHAIEEFFTKDLGNLVGVKAISPLIPQINGEAILYITVELEKMDDFIAMLYKKFKARFPKSGTYTIESLHIQNFISQIVACPSIGKYYSLGAIYIDVRNLVNFDEEKFVKYLLPFEPDEYMKEHFTFPAEETPLYHWNMLWG